VLLGLQINYLQINDLCTLGKKNSIFLVVFLFLFVIYIFFILCFYMLFYFLKTSMGFMFFFCFFSIYVIYVCLFFFLTKGNRFLYILWNIEI